MPTRICLRATQRFLDKVGPGGHKIFWSRGNGWVVAGLARVLTFMPRDYPTRPRYEGMFREMSARLLELQGQDGMWRADLLDAARFSQPESSGSAFFCYAMAWGVNQGLLPRETYQDAILKSWRGLVALRRPDNLPGFVQNVGAAPAYAGANESHLYGTGAFLLAATELSRMIKTPVASPIEPRALARLVPKRPDDITWENNRIGFRVYGPETVAREKTGSGIDVWAKSTRRMVTGAGDWYERDYHHNSGEGHDFYLVGGTRGCGAMGVWDGANLQVSGAWQSYKILESGPAVARIELTYAPWKVGERSVWETRVITLEADSQLNRIESTLHCDTPGELIVGIGIAKTKGDAKTTDAAKGLLATWSAQSPNGSLGCGVLVAPEIVVGLAQDAGNHLILVRAMPNKPLVYYAGAGWDKSGYFRTQKDWFDYLANFPR